MESVPVVFRTSTILVAFVANWLTFCFFEGASAYSVWSPSWLQLTSEQTLIIIVSVTTQGWPSKVFPGLLMTLSALHVESLFSTQSACKQQAFKSGFLWTFVQGGPGNCPLRKIRQSKARITVYFSFLFPPQNLTFTPFTQEGENCQSGSQQHFKCCCKSILQPCLEQATWEAC